MSQKQNPQFQVRVIEERTGIIIIIDDEPTLETAYERAKFMKVWAHTYDVACRTMIEVTPIAEKSK